MAKMYKLQTKRPQAGIRTQDHFTAKQQLPQYVAFQWSKHPFLPLWSKHLSMSKGLLVTAEIRKGMLPNLFIALEIMQLISINKRISLLQEHPKRLSHMLWSGSYLDIEKCSKLHTTVAAHCLFPAYCHCVSLHCVCVCVTPPLDTSLRNVLRPRQNTRLPQQQAKATGTDGAGGCGVSWRRGESEHQR